MPALFDLWNSIQQNFLPHTEEYIEGLTDKGAEFVRVAELAQVGISFARVRGPAFAGAMPKNAKHGAYGAFLLWWGY